MTVNRTTLLDLPLPVTGTESGTWGDTTNNGLTQYLDIAIAGTLVLSTDADVTLTSTEGDSSATNIGATTAQYAILRWTATGSTTRNITALAQSKTYVVINATGGTQSIVLRGAGPTTGVTIISGEKAHCVWNGSDFVKVSSSAAAGGSNTQVQYNSSGVLAGSSNMTFNGTKLTVAGFLDSALTSGRVTYATTSGELTDSANLLYSGTDLTVYGITVGRGAGAVSTNTAVGASALNGTNTGGFTTAIGYQAGYSNTSGQNTLIGANSGQYITTGTRNTGVGASTLGFNNGAVSITSNDNTAQGHAALTSLTSGASNTAIGSFALQANTTASNNTAVGYQAGYSNTTGADNTAVGYAALYANTTGANNTAVGYAALDANTTGTENAAFGKDALGACTTGICNTAVGYGAMRNLTTGSGNATFAVFGNAGNYNPPFDVTTENNRLVVGSTQTTNAYVQVAWTVTSDARDKTNIAAVPHGLGFINQLNPVSFQFKTSREDDTPNGNKRYGFLAQDILALEGDDPVIIDTEVPEKLKYQGESLVPVLVKAVQELSTQVQALQAEISILKGA